VGTTILCGCAIPQRPGGAVPFGAVDEESVIEEAARRIASAAPGAQVILFGSRARGVARADSDVDLLVIEPAVEDAAVEEVRLRRVLRGLNLFADVVVVSAADAQRLRREPSSTVGVALAEGRILAA
jgi:uncharacterized protein